MMYSTKQILLSCSRVSPSKKGTLSFSPKWILILALVRLLAFLILGKPKFNAKYIIYTFPINV